MLRNLETEMLIEGGLAYFVKGSLLDEVANEKLFPPEEEPSDSENERGSSDVVYRFLCKHCLQLT